MSDPEMVNNAKLEARNSITYSCARFGPSGFLLNLFFKD